MHPDLYRLVLYHFLVHSQTNQFLLYLLPLEEITRYALGLILPQQLIYYYRSFAFLVNFLRGLKRVAAESEGDRHGSWHILPEFPGQHLKGRHVVKLHFPYFHLKSESGVDLLPLEVGLDQHPQMVSLERITLNINTTEGDIPLSIDKILIDGSHIGYLVVGYI